MDAKNKKVVHSPPPPPSTQATPISKQKKDKKAEQQRLEMAATIEALSRCCETAKGKVSRIRNALEAAEHEHQRFNIHALKLYMKTVDAAYEEYNDFQNKIYLTDPSRKDEFEPKFIEFEELYEFCRISLSQMIDAFEMSLKPPLLTNPSGPDDSSQPGGSGTSQLVRFSPTIVLQQAALPSFDGRYEHWFKFKQMFRDIADKCTGDSAATKLHYLDKALIGKAQGAIDPQIIRDNDYEGAWRSLTEQFENLPALISDTVMKLLNLKAMTTESFQQLKMLVDEVEKCVSSLEFHQLKMDKLSEAIVTTLISTKLDQDTRKIWESNVKRGKLPVYKDMIAVLRNQQHVLERCESFKSKSKTQPARAAQSIATKAHTATIQKSEDCPVCCEIHAMDKCDVFRKLDVKGRFDKAKQLGLCFACLRKGHRTANCKSNAKCSKCSRRHHLMLHQEEQKSSDEQKPPQKKPEEDGSSSSASAKPENETTVANCMLPFDSTALPKHVLLATAVVNVFDLDGDQHKCRVLLDSGAMTNFVSQRLADLLQLKKKFVNMPVTGVNDMKSLIKFKVQCKLKSRVSEKEFCMDYLVVPKVTGALPAIRLNVESWPIPAGLPLADPMFFEPSRIDMIVGAEAFFDLLLSGKMRMSVDLPVLQESVLGWLVSGPIEASTAMSTARSYQAATVREVDEDLIHVLKQFWAVDDQLTNSKPEDNDCERHFLETFSRNEDGRYVVRLPFRKDVGELGESREHAESRFYQLERRLDNNKQLKKLYSEFISEYIALGHCRVLDNPVGGREAAYYMPHHCVLRPESSTTKLRVVFDASSKSASGQSLNDLLMVGPPVQENLFDIVLRFRLYRYAFTADVSKMYRMVAVHENDTKFQRILWREDRFQPLRELELTTVTYGTAAAPFLATRCLNQLAEDEGQCFPAASEVVKKSVYVDDVLSGAATLEEAKQLQNDLIALLERGGFQLHKWCANDASLLENIPVEKQEKQLDFQNRDVNETIKTLGLLWYPVDDCFTFCVKPVESVIEKITKRQVMSEIARVFDPLGLLAPVIVIAKMIMQDLWRSGLGWDEDLSADQLKAWIKMRNELANVVKMKIPRFVTVEGVSRYEIHGFSDASMKAYGSCVYLKSIKSDGSAETHLLCGKSRVAPIKETERQPTDTTDPAELTIPRLELCAAKLLSDQVTQVLKALDIVVDRTVLWSDSQIVLSWIEYMKPETPVFVRNRISHIRELTSKFDWKYVPTSVNPADMISRGVYPSKLAENEQWWSGPTFLRSMEDEPVVLLCAAEDSIQSPPTPMKAKVEPAVPENRVMNLILNTSNFRKLERIVSYVMRFVTNCKSEPEKRRRGRLERMEFREAVKVIIRVVQAEEYRNEIKCIESDKPVTGRLLNLRPMLDTDRLLRVGGRLQYSDLPYAQRHPMIIPEKHHLTEILVETLHREHLHLGQNGLLAVMRRTVWPERGKQAIRRVIRRCVTCFRTKPKETSQLMGDLPRSRVTTTDPFVRTGVDYAGPVLLKQGRMKAPIKGYIALFVCMSTKAIHIELVTSMTTDTFLAALQRFVGRRGHVAELFSDNGKNFIGANRELKELRALLTSQVLEKKVSDFCQARGISWSFNPPKAPHQGGLWEAGVKSAKHHLYRTLNESYLTYEEMNTLLVQIEAILNSRPLCEQSDDPHDYQALSPGHFLIGRELTAIAEPLYNDVKDNALSRYQLIQKRRQSFWKRWCNDYLTEQQRRNKWNKTPSFIRNGMLVILKEEHTPPQSWRLGRIVNVHPGQDGVIRVVTVRTSTGEYCRPTTQIAVLPIPDNEDSGDK